MQEIATKVDLLYASKLLYLLSNPRGAEALKRSGEVPVVIFFQTPNASEAGFKLTKIYKKSTSFFKFTVN